MSEKDRLVDSLAGHFSGEQLDAFCSIMKVPDFILPWLFRFFEPGEIAFILELNQQHSTDMGLQRFSEWIQKNEHQWPDDFLTRCYRRGVISLDDDGNYVPAGFHVRYEFWALFEGWQDLPGEIKDRLNQWELKSFVDRKKPHIDAFKKSGQREKHFIWPEYVLLDEALALIQKVPHVYLWPLPFPKNDANPGRVPKNRFITGRICVVGVVCAVPPARMKPLKCSHVIHLHYPWLQRY